MALVLAASSSAYAADEDPIANPRLPRMWKVVSRTKATAEQIEAIAKRLGVAMTSLENDVLDAGGVRVQINVAKCADETQAETLRTKFAAVHGGDDLYAVRRGAWETRTGTDVAEIVCSNRAVARKARHVLGWDAAAHWCGPDYFRATMQVAPLVRCDDMRWNRLFNLLSAPESPSNAAAIEEEAKAFKFADRPPWGKPDAPPSPRVHGVPKVQLVRDGSVGQFGAADWMRDDTSTWTVATESWPVGAPEVQAAVKEALGDDQPESLQERAERVLAWVHAHVRYGGDVVGSRYGTTKVIAQGFGRCWDQSDVFVTLCRAAGVPARQVGGWLRGGEGHVWAEIDVGEAPDHHLAFSVDPGTTWLGVSEDYVQVWESSDGRIPFVYWGAPKIEMMRCIK